MSDYHEMMRGEAYEASHFKTDRYAKPRGEVTTPPNRAEDPNRKVGRVKTQTCRWCAGTGEDTAFGGATNTCQSCGGYGVEEVQT